MLRSNVLEMNPRRARNQGDNTAAAPDCDELVIPPHLGESLLRHWATIWLESAQARLAAKGLYTVANGRQYTNHVHSPG